MPSSGLKPLKTKPCANCKTPFRPFTSLVRWCSPECGATLGLKKLQRVKTTAAKEEKRATRAQKEAMKTRSDWMKEAQAALNRWVRLRDKDLPCVSCGRHHQGAWHAGHFLSRGAHPELALEPLNLAKQCAPCNTHLSGNQIRFRQGLIERIGLERVEWLEGPHEPKRYTIQDLRDLRDTYRRKARELEKLMESTS